MMSRGEAVNKLILLLSFILCVSSCSTQPYFMSVNEDKIGLSRIESKFGTGRYFIFNSLYTITKEELDNNFQGFYTLTVNEITKQNICDNRFLILKQTLSYYDEGGAVSVMIKCA